jgi:uncharacterized protein
MDFLVYIAENLLASNFAGYLLSKGLTNLEEKKLIKEIEEKVTLAFYQSKKSFGDYSEIYYYAKIKDYYKYKRKECKEIPCAKNKVEETYYRFETEKWQVVGPIAPVEYGIRNVSYTTVYLLNNADTMHELKLKNWLEINVYKILREASKSKGISLIKEDSKFTIGNDFVQISDKNNIRFNNEIFNLDELRKI